MVENADMILRFQKDFPLLRARFNEFLLTVFFFAVNKVYVLFHRNPALEGEHWPSYTKDNPIYYIWNADDDIRGNKHQYSLYY